MTPRSALRMRNVLAFIGICLPVASLPGCSTKSFHLPDPFKESAMLCALFYSSLTCQQGVSKPGTKVTGQVGGHSVECLHFG